MAGPGHANDGDCAGWTSTGVTGTATGYHGNQFLKVETAHTGSKQLAVAGVSVP